MQYINIGLIFIAGLNVGLAFLIWRRNPKNKINISYALAVLFVGIWTLGAGMFRGVDNLFAARIWTWVQNGFGSVAAVSFYFFSLYFPFQKKQISLLAKVLVVVSIIIVMFVVVAPGVWYSQIYLDPPNNDYEIALPGYLYFVVFFLFYMGGAFYHLTRKYLTSEGFVKQQLKVVIYATGLLSIASTLFNVLLPYWINVEQNWIAPYFSIIMVIILTNYIFKKEQV
ncbi:hypothetical protein KKA15_00140 [Patescibacteria group bacterium]|nr:hypothetical protein [Patescibacteria group bacterium]